MTGGWASSNSDSDDESFRVFELADFRVTGRLGVQEKPTAPHVRLACMHLQTSLAEESPLKKLLRDDPPDEPWPPLDEDPRGEHSVLVCSPDGAAIPGRLGSQLSRGISA